MDAAPNPHTATEIRQIIQETRDLRNAYAVVQDMVLNLSRRPPDAPETVVRLIDVYQRLMASLDRQVEVMEQLLTENAQLKDQIDRLEHPDAIEEAGPMFFTHIREAIAILRGR
jgi:small-conductance mechanosensitive channel